MSAARRSSAHLLVGVVMVALALAGCGPDTDELRRAALDDAVATTVQDTLAFNVTVDADREALAGLGDASEQLAALLQGSSLAGVLEDDRAAVGLALAGVDLAQVRITGPGEQYVRFNLGALGELVTGSTTAVDGLQEALGEAGLDAAARDAVLAAAQGEWVQLVGTEPEDDRPAATSLRDALQALLAAAEPVGHTGDLEASPYDGRLDVEVDLELALAAAAQALAGIAPSALPTASEVADDTVPGRIHVSDGTVRSVVLELGTLTTEDGAGDGGVELTLDLRQLEPDEALVGPPEASLRVTLAELERAAGVLQQLGP